MAYRENDIHSSLLMVDNELGVKNDTASLPSQ